MTVTTTKEGGVALFLSPQPRDPEDGTIFVAAIAQDSEAKGEIIDMALSLPPDWQGQYTERLIPVALLADVLKLETMPEVTHLALLESSLKPNDPFLFGRTKIGHNSMVVWKDLDGSYRYFHCDRCAALILYWLTQEQENWSRPLN